MDNKIDEFERMIRVGIAYDFDGTLARGNIQENSFIPTTLGIEKDAFWANVKELSEENNMDEILSYMYLIIKKSRRSRCKNYKRRA